MKKTVKITSTLLCLVLFCSLTIGIIKNVIVNASSFDYENTPYETLTYQQLEDKTKRDSAPSKAILPQFTVFTYGCGGDASHWSSDSNFNFAK